MNRPINNIGLFAYKGNLPLMLRRKLSSFRQFSFPVNYFSGIDCTGKTLAVSIDYFLGKAPTQIIFVRMKLLGKIADFAIAAAEQGATSIVIAEFEGHKNLVVNIMLVNPAKAGPCGPNRPFLKPASQSPVICDRRLPDFSFATQEIPLIKAGYFNAEEKDYVKWLKGSILRVWQKENLQIAGVDSSFLIESAVETLVRSNFARLGQMTAWKIILPEDAEAIANRSIRLSPERLARMFVWLASEHLSLGQLSLAQTKIAAGKLIPHFYLESLTNKFRDEGVTPYDAWYFSVHFREPENGIRLALDRAKRLFSIHGKKGCQRSFIWRITACYGHRSESFLLRVFSNAKNMMDKYGKQGLTYTSAVYYALHNPRNTEKKMSKVIKEAEQLSKEHGITIAYALHLLRNKRKKLKKTGDPSLEKTAEL